METEKIFAPHDLKTVEIDVEKKIFRVNGEDFGSFCDGFTLNCNPNRKGDLPEYLEVVLTAKCRTIFASYDYNGQKTSEFHCKKLWKRK